MDRSTYSLIEAHMLGLMQDSAHDCQHIYRVLYYALDIARGTDVDLDVLIASALLHDIGRAAEYGNPKADHATVGAGMAYEFLLQTGWEEPKAAHVRDCVATHRYRSDAEPQSMEAKMIFDADKLDATGVIGIARTIMYKGIVGQPLYAVDADGQAVDGVEDKRKSVFREYNWKLKGLYDRFYTARAAEIASSRRQAAQQCYESMLAEVNYAHHAGAELLAGALDPEPAGGQGEC